ncbi:hypothetical protein MBLNU459_g5984t1 [Dothideomycetes sp. NU459]
MLHGGIPLQTYEHQRMLVTKARDRLLTQKTDTMAKRGICLIDAMTEADYDPTGPSDLRHVFERFWASTAPEVHRQRQTHPDSLYELPHSDQADDFEAWFYQAFQVESTT